MANSNIPKDPVMLLSFINMKLRDFIRVWINYVQI